MVAVGAWLAGIEDVPRLECEVLLGHTLNLSRAQIIARPENEVPRAHETALQAGLDALRRGVPLAYVIGEREFWGLVLKVTPAVLVPRPETELLVELVVEQAAKGDRILDLGTGSGAIALAVAHARADLEITATDNSPPALAVAEDNARRLGGNVVFARSRWFDNLRGKWEIIVSNPPYVSPDSPYLADLSAEPRCALVAEQQGLAALREIIDAAPEFLSDRGWLMLEHGFDQAAAVREHMRRRGFADVESHEDLAGIERATLGRWTPDT